MDQIAQPRIKITDHNKGFQRLENALGDVVIYTAQTSTSVTVFAFAVSFMDQAIDPDLTGTQLISLAQAKVQEVLSIHGVEHRKERTYEYDADARSFAEVAQPGWWVKTSPGGDFR